MWYNYVMKMRFLLLCLITVLGVISFLPFVTAAQSSSSILVNLSPESPSPNETVNITLNSYAVNLDSVLISWLVNNKNVSSAIGKKSFSTTAGAAGSEIVVLARISLPEGLVEKKITIKPASMVLLYQATDSFVPPFYKGKALPTSGSEIKVVAMPEVRTSSGWANSKNMAYSWEKDYTVSSNDSGFGKNYFIFINDYLENFNNIEATATTLDQKYSSSANISIGAVNPKILFYKIDDTLGTLWNRIVEDGYKVEGSETLVAIPYFISPLNLLHPNLVWNWFINDNMIYTPTYRKNLIPLQVQSGVSGTSRIRLEIENKSKIFQTANKEINLQF